MLSTRRILVALLSGLVFCTIAWTQEAPAVVPTPEDKPKAVLPDVIITATRVETPSFDLPYSAQHIDDIGGKGIRQPRSITEVLEGMPQVMVQKTGYGQGSPFIRGFTGFRNLVLIDGIRLNTSILRDGPNQYTTLIDPLSLRDAELVSGPGSVLYGSDALGGTLQFFTGDPVYTPEENYGGRIYTRYATAERSVVARVETSYSTPRLAVLIGTTQRNYNDYNGGRHSSTFENTGYREWSGDAKLKYLLREDWEMTFGYQHFDQKDVPRTHSTIYGQSYRGTTVGSDLKRDTSELRRLAFGRLNWQPNDERSAELTIAFTSLNENEERIRSNGRFRDQGIDLAAYHINARFVHDDYWNTLTAGVEYINENVDSFYREWNADGSLREWRDRGPVADNSTYQTLGVYVEDRIGLSDEVDVILGARWTLVAVNADEVDPDPSDATVFDDIDETYNAVAGNLRVSWMPAEAWRLYAGASQGFRAPNLSDLTRLDVGRSGEAEVPAPNLDPEYTTTFELGTKYQHDRLKVNGSYFYTIIKDMIVRNPTGTTNDDGDEIVTKDNVGDGYVHGLELSGEYQVTSTLNVFASGTWLEGYADSILTSGATARAPISRSQPAQGRIGVRYQSQETPFEFESDLRWAGQADRLSARDLRDTQRIPANGTPGYAVIGVRGRYYASENLVLFGGVENLTNRDYRVHGSGSNEPGTNVIFGFDWNF